MISWLRCFWGRGPVFQALFSAKGRMRRRDFWLWSIAVSIVFGASCAVVHQFAGAGTFNTDVNFKGLPSNGLQYWFAFATLALQWVWTCLYAKRWHDRNRSGWLAAIGPAIYLPQFVLAHFLDLVDGFPLRFAAGAIQSGLGFVAIIYGVWVLIDCGILDGTPGPNRYGPSPKGLGAPQADVF